MGFCEPREAHAARARIGRTQFSMGNAIKDLNVSALNCLVELQKSTADVCALRKREKGRLTQKITRRASWTLDGLLFFYLKEVAHA